MRRGAGGIGAKIKAGRDPIGPPCAVPDRHPFPAGLEDPVASIPVLSGVRRGGGSRLMRLACQQVSFGYPGAHGPIFRNLNWAIETPGFHALFGLSGVGKSTLARLLEGDLAPEQGTIDRIGDPTILYAYNTERLPGWYSVGEHLWAVTPSGRRDLLSQLKASYGLQEVTEQRYDRLSMGQKNRVNLVRYLVQDFDLLITDEVLANVDEPAREHILTDIKDRFPDRTFLHISHNVLEVARFCQKVYVLPDIPFGTEHLVVLDGLDLKGGQDASEALVQERVYAILQAARGCGA